MRELYRSDHFLVTLDEGRKLVRRQRTELAFASIAQVEGSYEALLAAAERVHRPEFVLLVDLRLAPPRNDPSFEDVVNRYYGRLYGGFRKVAGLVRFEAGRLQLLRLATPDVAGRLRVFLEEAVALDYLLSPTAEPAPSSRKPRSPLGPGPAGGPKRVGRFEVPPAREARGERAPRFVGGKRVEFAGRGSKVGGAGEAFGKGRGDIGGRSFWGRRRRSNYRGPRAA